MTSLLLLIVGLAILLADRFAHHDEVAARRFRELDPSVVGSELDLSRNRRWHRAGMQTRLLVVFTLALVLGWSSGLWVAAGLAFLIAGAIISLLFDILFNTRFGEDWDYGGTTAFLDEWLGKLSVQHNVRATRLAAALELTAALVGIGAWILIF